MAWINDGKYIENWRNSWYIWNEDERGEITIMRKTFWQLGRCYFSVNWDISERNWIERNLEFCVRLAVHKGTWHQAPVSQVQSLEPTRLKKRSNSWKLSNDFHIYPCIQIHVHTKYFTKKWGILFEARCADTQQFPPQWVEGQPGIWNTILIGKANNRTKIEILF